MIEVRAPAPELRQPAAVGGAPPEAPTLTLLMGANGAGKSRWAGRFRDELPSLFLNREMRADRMVLCPEAARWRALCVRDRRTFGIETTFTRAWRHGLIRDALERGFSLAAIFVGTADPALNVARVRARHRSGAGHLVAPSTVRRRWHACQSNLVVHAAAFNLIRIVDSTVGEAVEVVRIGRSTELYVESPAPWIVALVAGVRGSRRRSRP